MRTRLLMLAALVLAALLVNLETATAAQVCGCKRNSNGRVRRLTAGAPLTCRPSQTLICWNEDPPPGDISARVYNSANISIPDVTSTILPFDSERWDTDNIHDHTASSNCATVPNRCRLTAQTPGKYLIYATLFWQHGGGGSARELQVRVNGGNLIPTDLRTPSTITTAASVATHYALNAGDYVEVLVLQG